MPVLARVARWPRRCFTTRDMAILTGKSLSTVVQALRRLERQQVVSRIYRGVWSRNESTPLDPFELVPFLLASNRVYVSFISALHLHGIVGQIPQVVTLASTAHTRTLRTAAGTYRIHRIEPGFFLGFTWYRGTGSFLIAEPEKALLDCLYLAGRRTKRYAHFPELEFRGSFSFAKARTLACNISDTRLRAFVLRKLSDLKP